MPLRLFRMAPSWKSTSWRDALPPIALVASAVLIVALSGQRALLAIRRERESDQLTRTLIAEVSAQRLAETLRSRLMLAADLALLPPSGASISGHLALIRRRVDSLVACGCSTMPRVTGVFAVSEGGTLIEPRASDPDMLRTLGDSLRARARTPTEAPRVFAGSSPQGPWLLLVKQAPAPATDRFLAIAVDPPSLASHVLRGEPGAKVDYLPATLSGVAPRDSVAGFTIRTPNDILLARVGPIHPRTHPLAVARTPDSSLLVRAELDPRVSAAVATIVGPRVEQEVLLVTLLVCLLLTGLLFMALRARGVARFRQQFAVAAAHELRTPLTQVLLYGEALQLDRVRSEDDRRRAADIVVREGRRMMDAVEGILHHTRAERRQQALTIRALDITDTAREVVASYEARARSAGVSLTLETISRATARGDHDAFQRALSNLVDNAIRHAGARAIVVRVGATHREVRVEVDDDGCGIPRKAWRRIFEPFWREAEAAHGGTGLGLAIVAEIMRAMGGRVAVSESPPGGARFTLVLPAGAA